ncbi:hypothetical protein ACI782_12865 [Geodermatophilus sp. SYSU D00703]
MSTNGADSGEQRSLLYERVCESYHAINDFRMKLMGLLPVATGTGVFLLLSTNADAIGADDSDLRPSLIAIGTFGLLFTLGLYAYELFGIKKCHYLIGTGRRLEQAFGERAQFRSRPNAIARFVNEPFASAFIYPASIASWLFLALSTFHILVPTIAAATVFFVGLFGTLVGAWRIGEAYDYEEQVLTVVDADGPIDDAALKSRKELEGVPVDRAVASLVTRSELKKIDGGDVPAGGVSSGH